MIRSRIRERLYRRQPVFSFEFYPPKTEKGEAALRRALEELAPLGPDFVSVTYGAGGSSREKTRDIVCSMKEDYGLSAMAHLTCLGHSHDEVRALLSDYARHGITDILALRGDPPRADAPWQLVEGGPRYAVELIRIAREAGWFGVGVAGFPEIHPEATDLETDLRFLREKVEAGADFVITQLFFDNDVYFDFVRRARRAGVTVPIIPGVMPVSKAGQMEKFRELSGCTLPERLIRHIDACGEDENRIREIGLAYGAAQCADLLDRGAPGIHFYTLNQSRACHTIYTALHTMGLWAASD
jgi:methylenetetrahydrofolate reductase (NADPH)